MPTLMIVLRREIPDILPYVHGEALTEREDDLTVIARALGVTPLADFFGQGADETDFFLDDEDELGEEFDLPQETWFAAAEGLATIAALLAHVIAQPNCVGDSDRIAIELREWQALLKRAERHDVKWHVGVDF
ncbi:hypothetical protein LOC68_13850 [Blastopirellula sp. JC732]|uniref:Uncharacterized protein n=1 Tax=Blastopirellula sediminis TaxID=2894196 RepID=A0A9X1MPZ8_9BACT|nr:hypothetical protein [Blastopirellula sediminis]MCC9607228.1 hypothetical protein [Blastopirellula sediminis]MCC9629479.1 hypothetical protein [Blastopirellula sediminis]